MSYSIATVVDVTIKADLELVSEFLAWAREHDIHAIPGYAWVAGGHYRGIFDKKDEEVLEKFFAEHG